MLRKLAFVIAAALISATTLAATLSPVQLLNPIGSTSGQAIVSTGATSAPGWSSIVDSIVAGSGVTVSGATGNVTVSLATNGVALNQLAQQSANTVLANATGSTANVAAFSMPSCSGSFSVLGWTSGTGFTCNTAVNAAQVNGNPVGTSGAAIPLLNGANTWSGAQTFTSTITPSQTAGIVGTTTNNSANAGSVGEVISSVVASGSAVSLTTNVVVNITSISLTAGDWDVWGMVRELPAGTTTTQNIQGGVSTTSAAFCAQATCPGQGFYLPLSFAAGVGPQLPTGMTRLSLASTTTVYLVTQVGFSTSTCAAYGELIARRRR